MKPVINLDQLEMQACGEGSYAHEFGIICAQIGAVKLGYNLTVVPPSGNANFFHNHHANEEMFFIIEGSGLLRFGDNEYPLRRHDVIACPPGGRDGAHQIINTGDMPLRYLALSTKERVEVAEFPDSDKIQVAVGDYAKMDLFGCFPAKARVARGEGEAP